MYLIRRRALAISLLLFLFGLSSLVMMAQDTQKIRIVGSNITLPIIEESANSLETDLDISFEASGSSTGIAEFCNNNADIVSANRPMTLEEEQNCKSMGVEFSEILLAYQITAFITHPDNEVCLTTTQLNQIFAPSSSMTDWLAINPELEADLNTILPASDTVIYAALDSMINGNGLRQDQTVDDESAAIQAVNGDAGSISAVSIENNLEGVHLSDINFGAGCVTASVANVEARTYQAYNRHFLYVNSALSGNESLKTLLSELTSGIGQEMIQASGLSVPGEGIQTKNAAAINGETGRSFSNDVINLELPPNLFGQIFIAGAAHIHPFMTASRDAFIAGQSNVSVEIATKGQLEGLRRLCSGEIDIAMTNGFPTDEALAGCSESANNIPTQTISLGSKAVVLLGNAADTDLQCLTTDQLKKVWGASSAAETSDWQDVDASFSDLPLTLIAVRAGSSTSDLLLTGMDEVGEPVRADVTETNFDAAYRATAVSLVPGALTYMTWADYVKVQEAGQENIQLVSIDNGSGCISPTLENIVSGEYPLSRKADLLVTENLLASPYGQAFIWYLFSDANYKNIERNAFVGIHLSDLPDIRAGLVNLFTEAQVAQAARIEAEMTAEPEMTVEPEITVEPEATAEATEEN